MVAKLIAHAVIVRPGEQATIQHVAVSDRLVLYEYDFRLPYNQKENRRDVWDPQ